MTVHHLKIKPEYLEAVASGKKTFELRRDDRGFKVGDTLLLELVDAPDCFAAVEVTYILRNVPEYGLEPGYAILSIKPCGYRVPGQVVPQ